MKRFLLVLAFAVLGTFQAAHAESDTDRLAATLKMRYPDTAFTSVAKTPVAGLYEVVMGRKIAYTDAGGRFFMYGSLVDMASNQDLTASRLEALSRIDVSMLPLQDSFLRVNGNGSRTLYVFSDPDCPFCKRLEPELDKLQDVTIHMFLYPLTALHPDAGRKSVSIWCSAGANDRAGLWHRAVSGNENLETRDCDNPVARNIALGASLGFQGTPTLVATDGRVLPGMTDAASIDAWMARSTNVAAR